MNRFTPALFAFLVPLLSSGCSTSGNTSTSSGGATSSSSAGGAASTTAATTTATGTTATSGSTTATTTTTTGTTTGATSSSSSSSTGSGSCMPGDPNACPAGNYCKAAANCMNGACAPLGTEGGQKVPVCGCDGVTYFNSNTAGARGISIAHAGACSPGIVCSAAMPCAANQVCNTPIPMPTTDCSSVTATGKCWGMPMTCPLTIGAGTTTNCDMTADCIDDCAAIKAGKPYFTDNTCPL